MTIHTQQKHKIPDFSKMNYEEEANWWDTHDITDYLDELEPVELDVQLEKPKENNIVLRVQKPVKDRLADIAKSKGLNVSGLVKQWIMEKLQTL